MAPCRTLHRRQSRKREEIRDWIHADVRVEQHVQLLGGNNLPRLREIAGQNDPLISLLCDAPGNRVNRCFKRKSADTNPRFFDVLDEPLCYATDAVVMEKLREHPHAHWS